MLGTAVGLIAALRWSHVVVTSDGAILRCYVNGVAATLTATAGTNNGLWFSGATDRDNVLLGALKTTSVSSYFSGLLDDVRVYSRPLTGQEIQAIYNGGAGTEGVIVP